MILREIQRSISPDSNFSDKGNENIILERQQSIVDRFIKKSERISNLFSNRLSNSISASFMLPEYVVPPDSTRFIDEDDLKQYKIEVIPLNKTELIRMLVLIDKWKKEKKDFILSDLLLLDLITRMLCGLNKMDEWYMIDSTQRTNEMNKIFLHPRFQEIIDDLILHPTLIR